MSHDDWRNEKGAKQFKTKDKRGPQTVGTRSSTKDMVGMTPEVCKNHRDMRQPKPLMTVDLQIAKHMTWLQALRGGKAKGVEHAQKPLGAQCKE